MPDTRNDDLVTVAAMGVLAACLAAFGHEAAGHGGACLAQGGRIALLSNVYFRCDPPAPVVDLAGPIGNLVLAAWAFTTLAARKAAAGVHERLFLTLVFAFSAFWLAGLLLVCGLTGEGDAAFWARDATAVGPMVWRPALTGLGLGLYAFGIVATTRLAPPGPAGRLRAAWLAGALAVILAAVAYKGSPLAGTRTEALIEAAKTIGAASLPLWFLARGVARRAGAPAQPAPAARSWGWIGAAVVGLAAFVAALGHGLP